MTTRERKEEFLRGFGRQQISAAIDRALAYHGLAILSDDTIDGLVADLIAHKRLTQKLKRAKST